MTEAYSLCGLANYKLGRIDVAESSARAGLVPKADAIKELKQELAALQALLAGK